MWSIGSGRAIEVSCGRWDCSWCQRRKRAAASLVIASGLERAWARGERVRLVTLTDGSQGAMTVADFYDAWNRLRTRLRKSGELKEFAAVLEVQARGALHLHVLQTGSYIPQRKLKGAAVAAGFGRCTDIREIKPNALDDARGSAGYAVKQMSGYLTKQNAAALTAKTNKRRRPLRTSRGWGITLGDALKMLAAERLDGSEEERDEGPWAFVQVVAGGDLMVRADGEWHRYEGTVHLPGEQAAMTNDDEGA